MNQLGDCSSSLILSSHCDCEKNTIEAQYEATCHEFDYKKWKLRAKKIIEELYDLMDISDLIKRAYETNRVLWKARNIYAMYVDNNAKIQASTQTKSIASELKDVIEVFDDIHLLKVY